VGWELSSSWTRDGQIRVEAEIGDPPPEAETVEAVEAANDSSCRAAEQLRTFATAHRIYSAPADAPAPPKSRDSSMR
jgi:hypothetical protein